MLIITADDYGKNIHTTESILKCFDSGSITSASAMVFMDDSERAASATANSKLEIGLHLNFTQFFTSVEVPSMLHDHQSRVISFLSISKLAKLIHNPFLVNSFRFSFISQHDEFIRLYGKPPEFINGHHHMHLCTNMLTGNFLPKGSKVRQTFTFGLREKNPLNLLYRYMLGNYVSKRFISTDSFFTIAPVPNLDRVQYIAERARRENVEIEVHPENRDETEFLLGNHFAKLVNTVELCCFRDLIGNSRAPINQA